jgi:hypothetical protein
MEEAREVITIPDDDENARQAITRTHNRRVQTETKKGEIEIYSYPLVGSGM